MMPTAPPWPAQVSRRRPRVSPKGSNLGLGAAIGGGLGALLGAAFTSDDRDLAQNVTLGATTGVLVGGLGASAVNVPMSLEHALRLAVSQIGAQFVSLRHRGRFETRLVFETNGRFEVAIATADSNLTWAQVDLEDWLYEKLILSVISKVREGV